MVIIVLALKCRIVKTYCNTQTAYNKWRDFEFFANIFTHFNGTANSTPTFIWFTNLKMSKDFCLNAMNSCSVSVSDNYTRNLWTKLWYVICIRRLSKEAMPNQLNIFNSAIQYKQNFSDCNIDFIQPSGWWNRYHNHGNIWMSLYRYETYSQFSQQHKNTHIRLCPQIFQILNNRFKTDSEIEISLIWSQIKASKRRLLEIYLRQITCG